MTIVVNGFDFLCHVDLFPDPAALIADCDRNHIVTLAVTTTPKAWTQNRCWTRRSNFVIPAIGLYPELADQRCAEIALVEQLMAESPFVRRGRTGRQSSLPQNTSDSEGDVFPCASVGANAGCPCADHSQLTRGPRSARVSCGAHHARAGPADSALVLRQRRYSS